MGGRWVDELRGRQLGPFAWAPYLHTPLPTHPEPQPAPDSFSCFPKYSGHWTTCSLAHCLVGNRQGFILLPSPSPSGVALVNKGVTPITPRLGSRQTSPRSPRPYKMLPCLSSSHTLLFLLTLVSPHGFLLFSKDTSSFSS